ncbi:creatininase family protein [Mangrovicoccus sp. HB161399]|uniref:creatininase family protein n=1 Tax=Mangrovicoccus sp. HB161399 TaxID=2720392 RepID=UPI001552DD53|nr:creatininase family protein [Mangrovicoccus sp. HB161399]
MRAAALNDAETAALLARRPVAVLPLGALEAHGDHLPAGTDNILAERLCDLLEGAAEVPLYRLPLLPYGQVWSLEHAPASLGIGGETLVRLLCEIGRGCAAKGLPGLAVVNAHLGNAPFVREAQRALKEEGFAMAHLFYPGAAAEVARLRETPEAHRAYMHACEIETSYMLHLAPGAVRMELAIRNYPDFPADFGELPYRWTEFSASPVMGDARAATAEKGAAILAPVIARMAAVAAALYAG